MISSLAFSLSLSIFSILLGRVNTSLHALVYFGFLLTESNPFIIVLDTRLKVRKRFGTNRLGLHGNLMLHSKHL